VALYSESTAGPEKEPPARRSSREMSAAERRRSSKTQSSVLETSALDFRAAGAIRDEPVAVDGAVVVHPVLPLSLTFDHRVVTGGEAARFFKALVDALEQPDA